MELLEINKMINDEALRLKNNIPEKNNAIFNHQNDCPTCKKDSFMPILIGQNGAFACNYLTVEATHGMEKHVLRILYKCCGNCGHIQGYLDKFIK